MASGMDIKGWIDVIQEKVLNDETKELEPGDRTAIVAGLCLIETLVTDINRIADALELQARGG